MIWALLLVVLLVAAYLLLFQYPLRRIRAFRRGLSAASGQRGVMPTARGKAKPRRVTLPELRDFASSLLLGTSMQVTLAQALQRTAEQFRGRGLFGQRLNRHVEARLNESPEAVLQGLAEDFKSEHLEDIVRRIEIARQAGATLDDAFAVSVEAIEEDIRATISREIREWANTLTIPMIMGVFFSLMMLGLLPLVYRLARMW